MDDELFDLFETVKAVKRLKDTRLDNIEPQGWKETEKKRFKAGFIFKIASTAVAAIIIFCAASLTQNMNFNKKSSSVADNQSTSQMAALDGASNSSNTKDEKAIAPNITEAPAEKTAPTSQAASGTPEVMIADAASEAPLAKSAPSQNKSTDNTSPEDKSSTAELEGKDAKMSLMSGAALPENSAGKMTLLNTVVYAMEKAYQDLENYSGTIEIRTEENGKTDFTETIDVVYKKPNLFRAQHRYGTTQYVQVSDGDSLTTVDGDNATVDYVRPDKELWRYHIEEQIVELKQASEIRELGTETILEREAQVYEFRFSGDNFYHKIWVDKLTGLPVKKEFNLDENRKLVNEFKQLKINTQIDNSLFNYNPEAGKSLIYANTKSSIDEISSFSSIAAKITGNVPAEMKLNKVVKLQNDIYNYYANYEDSSKENFLDMYVASKPVTNYYVPGAGHGKLKDGWIEIQNGAINVFKTYIGRTNTVKWVGKNYEIVIVSSMDTGKVLKILQDAADSEMEPLAEEKLDKMGITPVITKEDH